jgi:hypothetical protein
MAKRQPLLALRGWTDVERDVAAARVASEYFWFLSPGPQPYDRFAEIHTRMDVRKPKKPRADAMSLPVGRIRYYINPLRRLIQLHQTSRELMSGLVHHSPFERADALRRV